jgi:hypothetical protein
MKKATIFGSDNKEWTCFMLWGSTRSELYSIVCKPLCIIPAIPGTKFSSIFNSTNRGTGTTYSYGYDFPHYYKMIIDILKSTCNFYQVSRRRKFFITSSFQILANKKYKK